MDIKKLRDTAEEGVQTKTNFGQLINQGGVGLKSIVSGDGMSRLQAMSEALYQIVDLPSNGWGYPANSVLASGQIKLKYPTGADEAILASQHLIRKGISVDEYLRALILDNCKLQDLHSGDKAYLMFAARRLTYGNDYQIQAQCTKCGKSNEIKLNLAQCTPKDTPQLFEYLKQQTEYEFELPSTHEIVKFELENGHIANIIKKRTENSKSKNAESLIQLSCQITQYDDATQYADILKKLMLARPNDLKELRLFIAKISPDINIRHKYECQYCDRDQEVMIPITVSFFWPTFA